LLVLFLLVGFVIPSSLIASSIQEFSYLFGEIVNPFIFIGNSIVQSAGIFIVWPLLIYLMFFKDIRGKVTKLAFVICVTAVINLLLFPGNYGYLTTDFVFSEGLETSNVLYFLNLFVLAVAVIMALFLIYNFRKTALYGLIIAVCAMFVFGSINSIKINKGFQSFQSRYEKEEAVFTYEPVFQFSKTGKNVIVIMLDRAISGYIPYIFDEKRDLYNYFDGFTWYRNTISFGKGTVFGSPALFGGYEYTLLEMNARSDIPLVEKQNEALLMLPRIFLDKGYKVTVTNPPFSNYSWISDLSIFDNYPEIHAENIIGKFNKNWLFEKESQGEQIDIANATVIIEANLIRFSIFKIAPVILRNFIYDNGRWLKIDGLQEKNRRAYRKTVIDNYIALDVLDRITQISSLKFDTYTAMYNALPHEPAFLQFPDYVPTNNIIVRGNDLFTNNLHYDVNIASMLLLGKWFNFLKNNDIYDNTRIIIVSDHGRPMSGLLQNPVSLPNRSNFHAISAFLLVKDFNSHGRLSIDDSFMTNADVPLIALEGIVENPVNPWSGKIIKSDKEEGVTVTSSMLWNINQHPKNVFNIKPDEWLHVHTDIYDSDNWSQITVQENKP